MNECLTEFRQDLDDYDSMLTSRYDDYTDDEIQTKFNEILEKYGISFKCPRCDKQLIDYTLFDNEEESYVGFCLDCVEDFWEFELKGCEL